MPRHVIEDAQITINGVVLSGRVKKVTIRTFKRPPAQVTAMTDSWEENLLVDIKGWKASFELYQDYSTGSVYETLKGIFDATGSSGVALIVRPTTGIRTTGNPEFQGQILLEGEFPQLEAEYGGVNMAPVSFLGTGALSFLTSSS
jgi:hypothetical protein